MDAVTHALAGAALAETGLKRLTPLATATLVTAAVLPDIDAFSILADRNFALGVRRGWTHGVVAMAVMPLVLVGLVKLYDVHFRRRRRPDASPARPAPLLFLAYLSFILHPALDWLNSYGIRFLMPLDGRWFYGDALHIVDPWVILLVGAPVAIVHSRTRFAALAWLVPAALLGAAMLAGARMVPTSAALVWALGVGAVVVLRVRRGPRQQAEAIARVALAVGLVYVLAMVGTSRLASSQSREWLASRGIEAADVAAMPAAGNPFVRQIVAVTPERYVLARFEWLSDEPFRLVRHVPRQTEPGPIVKAALDAPAAWGVRTWMRFPTYRVQRLEDGWRVSIQDVRFGSGQNRWMGLAVVELDDELNVRGD
jgi:inner membrane protein